MQIYRRYPLQIFETYFKFLYMCLCLPGQIDYWFLDVLSTFFFKANGYKTFYRNRNKINLLFHNVKNTFMQNAHLRWRKVSKIMYKLIFKIWLTHKSLKAELRRKLRMFLCFLYRTFEIHIKTKKRKLV